MEPENRSLDLLGVKGISDAIRIATGRFLDGAAAFLSRVCLPAAEEFGLALRDRISAWRARNASRMLETANRISLQNGSASTNPIHPRLVNLAVEQASWTDDDEVQNMWAGLLASAQSPKGGSDENLLFMRILEQLSSLQVRILRLAVDKAKKYDEGHGLPAAQPLRLELDELLAALGGPPDLQRVDRELDHLSEIGLIGSGLGGGLMIGGNTVDLTPTGLMLHLYVRAQGSKDSPCRFWNLTIPPGQPS